MNHKSKHLTPAAGSDEHVVLLKPFGELIYWREFDVPMVAPPWLVYAELLASGSSSTRGR